MDEDLGGNQCRYRQGRLTIDVVNDLVNIAKTVVYRKRLEASERNCVNDVKSVFNSAGWDNNRKPIIKW